MQSFKDLLVGEAAASATLIGGFVMASAGGSTMVGLLGAAATLTQLWVVLPGGRGSRWRRIDALVSPCQKRVLVPTAR